MGQLADDLRAARKLIEPPAMWGKGHALDGPPRPCLCAYTACYEVSPGPRYFAMVDRLDKATPQTWWEGSDFGTPAASFNDDPTTTHNDVLALFDRAIAAADATP